MPFDEIKAKLSAWGIRGGVDDLVQRWRAHVLGLEKTWLRWERHFDPGVSRAPAGIARLRHLHPGRDGRGGRVVAAPGVAGVGLAGVRPRPRTRA